jgi:hypothetical protein
MAHRFLSLYGYLCSSWIYTVTYNIFLSCQTFDRPGMLLIFLMTLVYVIESNNDSLLSQATVMQPKLENDHFYNY